VGPDSKRILIAGILSIAILVAWQLFFAPPPPKPIPPPAAPAAPAEKAAPPPAAPAAPVPPPPPVPSGPEETAVLEGPSFRATFTSRGGALKSFELKGRKFQDQENGKEVPMELVRVAPGAPYPFAVGASPELGGAPAGTPDPSFRATMRIVSHDSRSVTFEGRVGADRIVKRFALIDGPYVLSMDLRVEGDRTGSVEIATEGFLPSDAPKSSFFSGGAVVDHVRPICRAGSKTVRFDEKHDVESPPGAASWVGVERF
jgi:YidC/Oxa1 family membrane protein insertase